MAVLCLLPLAGGGESAPAGPGPGDAPTLYVLHQYAMGDAAGAGKNLWCEYHDEAAWRAAASEAGALETGSVEFVGNVPKVVKVTEQDKPAADDWMVQDRYYLNNAGMVMSLQRTTNVPSSDVSRKEVYEARNGGRLALQHVLLHSIQTGQAMVRTSAMFPKLPISSRVENFPFGELIQRRQEVAARDGVCVTPREVPDLRVAQPR